MFLEKETFEKFGKNFDQLKDIEKLIISCDYCNCIFEKLKREFKRSRNKLNPKDCCSSKFCQKQKREEVCLQKYGCKNGGGAEEIVKKIQNTCLEKYGVNNYMETEEFKEKRKQTCLEKYGVENYTSTEECQDKKRKTCLEKYGVNNPAKSQIIKNKIKQTCLEKYGVDSHNKYSKCKEKKKKTCMDKFGVEYSFQSEEIKNKIKNTLFERYGIEHPLQYEKFIENFEKTCLEKYGFNHYSKTEEWKKKTKDTCLEKYGVDHYNKTQEGKDKINKTCREKYNSNWYLGSIVAMQKTEEYMMKKYGVKNFSQTEEFIKKIKKTCLEKYGKEWYYNTNDFKIKCDKTLKEKYGTSDRKKISNSFFGKTQGEISQFLLSIGIKNLPDRIILDGKEIDMFCQQNNIGIEYCGNYWHSDASPSWERRGKNFHYYKFIKCLEKQVKLITIFEDEWLNKKELVKSFLSSTFGIFKTRIGARKCNINEIDKINTNIFLQNNHLLGKTQNIIKSFGLLYNDEIIGAICLSKHHRFSNKITLSRMCFKQGYQIVGGASKLLNKCIEYCKNNNINELITWSDNRWTTGDIYVKLNFTLDCELPPDYSYVDLKTLSRISKQSCMKKKIGCPKEITEKDWMKSLGYARIWDCGKKRWIINP